MSEKRSIRALEAERRQFEEAAAFNAREEQRLSRLISELKKEKRRNADTNGNT